MLDSKLSFFLDTREDSSLECLVSHRFIHRNQSSQHMLIKYWMKTYYKIPLIFGSIEEFTRVPLLLRYESLKLGQVLAVI